RRRLFLLFPLPAQVGDLVHRHDDDEVHGGGNEEEVDQSREDCTRKDLTTPSRDDDDAVEIRLAEERPDERVEHLVGEGFDGGAEGRTYDDADCPFRRVAAGDEVFEALKYVCALED